MKRQFSTKTDDKKLSCRGDLTIQNSQITTELQRFEALKKRLQLDVVLCHQYTEVVNDYLEQGIVEDVVEKSSLTTVKYYISHHAVLREDKVTTKLRAVFDASSHDTGSPLLNDCLPTGPNLNPDLLRILIKFILHAIAFTVDIKKAFL